MPGTPDGASEGPGRQASEPEPGGYGASWRRLREEILLRDGSTCTIDGCGAPGVEVDHIVPRHLGGTDDRANLRALCVHHHRSKTGRERGRLSRGHRV